MQGKGRWARGGLAVGAFQQGAEVEAESGSDCTDRQKPLDRHGFIGARGWRGGAGAAVQAVRARRRRELFRIACADLLGVSLSVAGLEAIVGSFLLAAAILPYFTPKETVARIRAERFGPIPVRVHARR